MPFHDKKKTKQFTFWFLANCKKPDNSFARFVAVLVVTVVFLVLDYLEGSNGRTRSKRKSWNSWKVGSKSTVCT